MGNIPVRMATEGDLEAIIDITNHYIRTSSCTMKEREENLDKALIDFRHRRDGYPLLVAEHEGKIAGWGDLSPHSERSAYRFTVHDAVYVRDDLRGQGIGSALLEALISASRQLGYHSIVAVIAASQTPSIGLHAKFGFREAGRLSQAGHKFGRWEDVVTLQLML